MFGGRHTERQGSSSFASALTRFPLGRSQCVPAYHPGRPGAPFASKHILLRESIGGYRQPGYARGDRMNPYETIIDNMYMPCELPMPMSRRLLRKKLLATRSPLGVQNLPCQSEHVLGPPKICPRDFKS